MKVVEIRQEAGLQNWQSGWNELLRRSASDTVFLTWEWVTAWWSVYGTPGDLRILAAMDDNGALVGIAPLCRRVFKKYGQTYASLSFLGDRTADSDYLDFIAAAGWEKAVQDAFSAHWAGELRHGTVLELNEIPQTSPHLPWLEQLAGSAGMISKTGEVPCGTVRLPGTWEEYLGMLRPRFRTKVRSVLRGLEERPEIRFGFCENLEQVERLLPVLFDLHTRRWEQDGRPGVFGWERKRAFYRALSAVLLERGWLRFSWLEWKGRVLACQYGFAYGGVYSQLQEGYEPASEHWNLGVGLRAWSIREFLKQGLVEYDFLGGMGRHKSDWGAEVKHSKHILLARENWKSRLLCQGPEWEESLKESVKKVLPGKLLHARTRLQSGGGRGAKGSAFEWMRKAGAQCYFHSGLPGLVRPLRDRYQFSANGHGPGIHKRKQASARILYYHRVNDEQDPFFPATPTAVFEQQMRIVAKHYKVVGLGELLGHLEGGSAEPVLAITFDDGYQDNFHNAFPILQRYGLPATIFLTTGGMDSREPLWFEQLAHALKTTAREFIDLEIDLPRRFWTRTTAERLDSNGGIYAILRGLPDGERQQWLAQILRHLEPAQNGERHDKMLVWEQVRQMKRQRIDFGGHTVTHPFLSKLTREQAAWEVSECKRRIEQELQSPAAFFAYPSGRDEDVSPWNREVLREAGYEAAVTTTWGMNYLSTDRMALRRGGPWEEVLPLFVYKLDWYQFANG